MCGPLPKTLTLFMTKICDFPYPIYDLTKNLIPYFVKGFCCLYFLANKAAGGEEDKARMEGGGHDKEVASSKKVHSRLQCKNRYPIYDQNGRKTLPSGAAHTYIAHIREYHPPRILVGKKLLFCRLQPLPSLMLSSIVHCWFARDVTAAMLVVKNKSISPLWELNSIFM